MIATATYAASTIGLPLYQHNRRCSRSAEAFDEQAQMRDTASKLPVGTGNNSVGVLDLDEKAQHDKTLPGREGEAAAPRMPTIEQVRAPAKRLINGMKE